MPVFAGIDASLTSTAVTLYIDGEWRHHAIMKNFKMTKWPRIVSETVSYTSYERQEVDEDDEHVYAQNEASKMLAADHVSDAIVSIFSAYTDRIYCCIEGYSFASQAGHLIDLVTMGTLIRQKIGRLTASPLHVLSPGALKKHAAQSTYRPPVKKPLVWRNNQGIAGGAFTKHHMLQAAIENEELARLPFVSNLSSHWTEINSQKTIKSPIPDVVDSLWLCHACRGLYS